MFPRIGSALATGLVLFVLGARVQAEDRNQETTYTEFYGIVKPDSDDAEYLHLRIVDGQVFGVRTKSPREFHPVVRDFHNEEGKPMWVSDQIVFNDRKDGGVRFLVADHSTNPPRLILKDKQLAGFAWKAVVLKSKKLREGRYENDLMYLGTSDAAGTEYWLGFDQQASHVEKHNIQLQLRALTLARQKDVQFQYEYERLFRDDGK